MYIKTLLLPADAAGKRPSQSTITIATTGNISCVYHHADFQRQLPTDEQQTLLVARYYLHRDIHRRQNLSLDAVRPATGSNFLPHHQKRDYHFQNYLVVRFNYMAKRGQGAKARDRTTPTTRTHAGTRRSSYYLAAPRRHSKG